MMSMFGPAGEKLAQQFKEFLDQEGLELDPHDRELLKQICLTVDRLDHCAKQIKCGNIVELSDTGVKLINYFTEERLQRQALSQLIRAVGFPSGIVETLMVQKDSKRTHRPKK